MFESLCRGPVSQGLMGSLVVVEVEVSPQLLPGFSSASVSLQVDLLSFTVRHNRSTKMLSWYLPLPFWLIFTQWS